MPIDMDAPFKRSDLIRLAHDILALDCSGKSLVHAEKMLRVKEDEYSRSFYEAATRIRGLMSTGSALATAVESVAGWIPAVGDIEFKVCWWDGDIVSVTKQQLFATATEIDDFAFPSPDRNLAARICSKKASKDEWRLFALRYVDYKTRISKFDVLLWDFCSDIDRTKKEIAALKPWINKVCGTGDGFDVERPVLPPWKDAEYWEADLDEWGYGDDFSPSFDTQATTEYAHSSINDPVHKLAVTEVVNSSVIALNSQIPTAQNKDYTDVLVDDTLSSDEEHNPAYNDEVVNRALIDDEDYEVDTLDGDVFEDEELYAAQDEDKKRLLADAINLPQSFHIEHLSNRTAQKFPQLARKSTGLTVVAKEQKLKATVLTDEEKEQRWADSIMLSEAMSFSSFKEEMRANEEDMKKDPDNKLLNLACERLIDAIVEADAKENGVKDRPKELCSTVINPVPAPNTHGSQLATVTGSDRPSTSAAHHPVKGLLNHIDVNVFSQVIAPSVADKIWPPLSNKKPATTVQQNVPSTSQNAHPVKNVWVEKSKARKTFMNAGIGGKLTMVQPTAPEFFIDVNKAHTIQDIWGFSLLGQYVGHNPGHHLIHAMIKGWGVRAKYKLEEGWFIFSFESETDRDKVLIGGPYLIHGRPMLLKNIPDKFAFNRKDLALVPLWVRIYGLASRFWTTEILGGIASYVGCPMYMDPVTDSRKRNAYARVLVEINLAEPVTKSVPIRFSDGDSVEVHFMVENQPKFCTACCSYGHACVDCQFLVKKATAAVISQEKKAAVNKPQAVLSSHDNSHPTMPSPAANMSPTVATNRVLDSAVNTPVPVHNNQVNCHLPEASPGTNAKALVDPNILRSSPDVAKQSLGSKDQQQQVQHPTGPIIQQDVHNDVELANQFALLNGAPEHNFLGGDIQSEQLAVNTSMEVTDHNMPVVGINDAGQIRGTTQGSKRNTTTGNMNKKVAHSTPACKTAYNANGLSPGPATRSKMKILST